MVDNKYWFPLPLKLRVMIYNELKVTLNPSKSNQCDRAPDLEKISPTSFTVLSLEPRFQAVMKQTYDT